MRRGSFAFLAMSLATLWLAFGLNLRAQENPRSTQSQSPAITSALQATAGDEAAKGYAKNVLPLYIDCAKAFSQMAIGALSLTIVFREKVLGTSGPMKVSWLLIASWICFLISIGAGLCYQWLAIRLISLKDGYETPYFPLKYGVVWPGNIFGLMLVSFFFGACLLVITSARQLTPHLRSE